MCIYIDDDEGTLLSNGGRRARKPHRCDECSRTIEPREQYQYWTSVYDGNITTMRMCAHCWATIDAGAQMTGCPRNWYWDMVFDLNDEECGFIGDIIRNHDLTRRQAALMRLCAHHGKSGWRAPDGSLYPIPQPVAPLHEVAA